MIVLHGRGDSLKPFRSIKKELKLPQMNYLLLNAPRKYDGGYTWYAFPPNQGFGVLQNRKRLNLLLDELAEQGWESQNIFFYGLSQGSLISCDFAMHSDRALGGVIAISGYIYFFSNWKKKLGSAAWATPYLITHGCFDDLLPINETRQQVERLKKADLPILWKEFNKEHEIDLEIETPFIRNWVLSRIHREENASQSTSTRVKSRLQTPLQPQPIFGKEPLLLSSKR